jgi:hypothetical protein
MLIVNKVDGWYYKLVGPFKTKEDAIQYGLNLYTEINKII